MENTQNFQILIALARTIFRATCFKYDYNLETEDKIGVLDDTFFGYLVIMSQEISEKRGEQPSDVLVGLSKEFATIPEARLSIMSGYALFTLELMSEKENPA